MTSLSGYQHTFRIGKPDPSIKHTQLPTHKRNRQILSCVSCKSRKLKCDRQQPCQTCVKRGSEHDCSYASDTKASSKRERDVSHANEAQQRLQRLEQMVSSLVQGKSPPPSSSASEGPTMISPAPARQEPSAESSPKQLQTPPVSQCSNGHLDRNGAETSYYGATHWVSLLEDIRSVQQYLQLEEPDGTNSTDHASAPDTLSPDDAEPDTDIAFGASSPSMSANILDSLPSRQVMDNLLSTFFTTRHVQIPIIHRYKFQREYERFLADRSSASIIWISILYSMLFLSNQLGNMSGKVTGVSPADSSAFLSKAKQALVQGNYRSGKAYSVESVLMLAICYFYSRDGVDSESWIIMGIGARLAMKLGYHRDPKVLPPMSPFEAEMRRRAFFQIEAFDLLLSIQSGLPTIVHEEECDTEAPSNLFDSDFDEHSDSIPPSRPETEFTPMLYYRYKCRLSKVYRRVYRKVLSLGVYSHDDILRFDRELRASQASIPPPLRMNSVAGSITDESSLILQRMHCEQMYLKGLCILHRPYLSRERSNPAFAYSRSTCTEAALRLLKLQADVHFTCQPGAKFSDDGWIQSSITAHDFLLAAMIISVDVNETHLQHGTNLGEEEYDAQIVKYDALSLAQQIWRSKSESLADAKRAVKVLSAMFAKVPRPTKQTLDQGLPTPTSPESGEDVLTNGAAPLRAEGMQDINPSDAPLDSMGINSMASADEIDAILGDSAGIDWSLLDQYVLTNETVPTILDINMHQ